MMHDQTRPSDLMTVKEVALYLGVSERTIYRYLKEYSLPGLKVGRLWRFRDKAIEAWLQHAGMAESAGRVRTGVPA